MPESPQFTEWQKWTNSLSSALSWRPEIVGYGAASKKRLAGNRTCVGPHLRVTRPLSLHLSVTVILSLMSAYFRWCSLDQKNVYVYAKKFHPWGSFWRRDTCFRQILWKHTNKTIKSLLSHFKVFDSQEVLGDVHKYWRSKSQNWEYVVPTTWTTAVVHFHVSFTSLCWL